MPFPNSRGNRAAANLRLEVCFFIFISALRRLAGSKDEDALERAAGAELIYIYKYKYIYIYIQNFVATIESTQLVRSADEGDAAATRRLAYMERVTRHYLYYIILYYIILYYIRV